MRGPSLSPDCNPLLSLQVGRYDPVLMRTLVKYHHASLLLTLLMCALRRPWIVEGSGPKPTQRLLVAALVGVANVLLLWFSMTLARWILVRLPLRSSAVVSSSAGAERRHSTGRERMGSPTLQTLQDPILRPAGFGF